jgi:hypothetical protein
MARTQEPDMSSFGHELREMWRAIRYPGYQPIHCTAVQDKINAVYQKVIEHKVPLDSTWKRNPPKKEVVRVERVWFFPSTELKDGGWTVRAHPVRGGELVADLDWFLENFTRES